MNAVKTWWNFDSLVGREMPTGVSLTVPDQTLSLKDLLARYTRGQDVVSFTPIFNGDSDLPDPSRMDALERLDYARHIKNQLTQLPGKFKKHQEDLAAAAAAAAAPPEPTPEPKPAP